MNRGKYFTPIATETSPSKAARDRELAQQLWRISEQFVKDHDPSLNEAKVNDS